MEMIRISGDRIKIMMSREDMETYSLSCECMDYENEETRHALRSILEEASRETGFDAAPGKVFVQVYESRAGGCEMYVTRLPEKEAEGEEAAGDSVGIFGFDSLRSLAMLCKRLCDAEYEGGLSVMTDRGRWYLRFDSGDFPLCAGDYGERLGEHTAAYITEYGCRLYGREALRQLAELR